MKLMKIILSRVSVQRRNRVKVKIFLYKDQKFSLVYKTAVTGQREDLQLMKGFFGNKKSWSLQENIVKIRTNRGFERDSPQYCKHLELRSKVPFEEDLKLVKEVLLSEAAAAYQSVQEVKYSKNDINSLNFIYTCGYFKCKSM